jgi:hypothetical protein
LTEKDTIISKIKEYNDAWTFWAKSIESGFEGYKRKLIDDLKQINESLGIFVTQKQNLQQRQQTQLTQNVKDIQSELNKTIAEQLIKLTEKDEQIKMLQRAGVGFVVNDAKDAKCDVENEQINALKRELEEVKRMLTQNEQTKIDAVIDYDNCYNIVQNFLALNNVFYRKQEMIKLLDGIINSDSKLSTFSRLNETTQANVRVQFNNIKEVILKHIAFLDLDKYVASPDFQYLKSKATRNKVSPTFCTELTNVLEYWNENKAEYRKQDIALINIYEDLMGAVRVYVRIKPLNGIEQKNKTVSLQTIGDRKQKGIVMDCNNKKSGFGEFYGVFEPTYSNLDVYTGVEDTKVDESEPLKVDVDNILQTSDTVSPGLYSTFRQVEDGYSIVLFGYGYSGSGKSFTLLGSNRIPGLVHYGLSNLQNVQNIKLKYLFEQYYRAVDVNFAKVRGSIHNLIREVPQMREYAKDERTEFGRVVPANINVDALKVEDLFALTEVIDNYRVDKGRIRKTPNNPVSSRSHLYFVFEVTFTTGKVGYVTIVDTAGRESPVEIFNTFLNGERTKLASIMSPAGGETAIAKYKRESLDPEYTPSHILEVLREGFYINETINHLVYYFNKKNYRNVDVRLQPADVGKYNMKSYYVNPTTEETSISTTNNCLTIPIMNFLDALSNRNKADVDWKPTKFSMMCMIRQEERYCDQILETLEFAQNIKSS